MFCFASYAFLDLCYVVSILILLRFRKNVMIGLKISMSTKWFCCLNLSECFCCLLLVLHLHTNVIKRNVIFTKHDTDALSCGRQMGILHALA